MTKNSDKIILVGVFLSLLVLAASFKLGDPRSAHSSASGARTSAEWWDQGSCTECHRRCSEEEQARRPERCLGDVPSYHKDPRWAESHGWTSRPEPTRCFSCHTAPSCKGCHQELPASHTQGFLEPLGSSDGTERHLVLARHRPEACLTCHPSFIETCAKCHTVKEVQQWDRRARARFAWPQLVQPLRKQE